jgi:dTDP-4-dehydrorhamnose 3,5-epimerase
VRFIPTRLEGAWLIELDPVCDERGFFARSWDRNEWAERGLDADVNECGISYNARRGTLRGLHYQAAPLEQTKLVRCTTGAIHDVIVDLRIGSKTRGRWQSFELSARNRRLLYIPKGFAHGFQTLTDEAEAFYQMTGPSSADHARGIRWDDPKLAIDWPAASDRVISSRDLRLPLMEEH